MGPEGERAAEMSGSHSRNLRQKLEDDSKIKMRRVCVCVGSWMAFVPRPDRFLARFFFFFFFFPISVGLGVGSRLAWQVSICSGASALLCSCPSRARALQFGTLYEEEREGDGKL